MGSESTAPSSFLKKHFLVAKVSQLPLKEAILIDNRATAEELVQLMVAHASGAVLVHGSGGALEGIVTERDLVNRHEKHGYDLRKTPVTMLMTPSPHTIRDYTSIGRALYYLSAGGYRHLPVLGREGGASKMLSVGELVDLLYHKIAQKAQKESEEEIAHHSDVAEFFGDPISSLEPHPPVSAPELTPVRDAVIALATKRVGSVVITNDAGSVRGIFTEHDLVHRVLAKSLDPHTTPLKKVMTECPRTLLAGSTVAFAFRAFSKGSYRHLPVVDENEKLVGILSVKNFITALARGIVHEIESTTPTRGF